VPKQLRRLPMPSRLLKLSRKKRRRRSKRRTRYSERCSAGCCQLLNVGQRLAVRKNNYLPTSGTDSPRQILRARISATPYAAAPLPLVRIWIAPERVGAAFAFEKAPVFAQMTKQRLALHCTVKVSWIASGGMPRRPSSRRSSRMSRIASPRLARHSSTVRPYVGARDFRRPATNHSPSRSITAVNSFRIG